jgi:hypothetical protein
VGTEVEAGGDPVLEEHHPHLLPVGVVHGGVEGHELEIGPVGPQPLVDGIVEHAHVVVCDVGGKSSDPVDIGIHLVVDLVVPVRLHPDPQLELRVDQTKQN